VGPNALAGEVTAAPGSLVHSGEPPVWQNHIDVTWELLAMKKTLSTRQNAKGSPKPASRRPRLQQIFVDRIRPEEGLGRKRDREGHRELCRSIEQFGVLTPITVRLAPDGTGDYLLIKGQGRTLACRLLGIEKVPAVIVSDDFAENEKVQQFLVENVARLKMRPIDRALLIAHARGKGEETADVASRFGVSPATVRRLEAQMDGASSGEVAALRDGNVNLALHAVIARHVPADERAAVIRTIGQRSLRTKEVEALFLAIGWRKLFELGPDYQRERLRLLDWACGTLTDLPANSIEEHIRQLATALPMQLDSRRAVKAAL
jgi:ParB/RepB/Spo0J family partition protein